MQEREAKKQEGAETLGDLWKGEGRDRTGWGRWGKQNGHYRDFQEGKRNLKEVGLGWINGGRIDHGFGWGKIRDGSEQLF